MQFNLQSIVTDVSHLWQLFHDFPCHAWALALCSERILTPDKGESAVLFSLQPPSIWMTLDLSVIQSTQCRWKIQQSSSAGGFNGNCKTLKHPISRKVWCVKLWSFGWIVDFSKKLNGKGPNQQSNLFAPTGRRMPSNKVRTDCLQLCHLQHFSQSVKSSDTF